MSRASILPRRQGKIHMMNKILFAALLVLPMGLTNSVQAETVGIIIARDGSFIGSISNNKYDENSICNSYGNYGSRYSSESIWNNYSDYGSRYSDISAYNPRAKNPPLIVSNGQAIGILTKNPNFRNRIDPDFLISMCH